MLGKPWQENGNVKVTFGFRISDQSSMIFGNLFAEEAMAIQVRTEDIVSPTKMVQEEIQLYRGLSSTLTSCDYTQRPKKPDSHVKHLHWLHILLLVLLLAAQASCETSATPSPLSITTTNAQTSVYYFVFVTVDINEPKDESEIRAWLSQVFQNELQSCVAPNHGETTSNGTTTAAATTIQSNGTTTAAATTIQSNNTTTAAATTIQSNNTTTAAATTIQSNNTTTAAATTIQSNNTTTAAATTTLQSNNTTTTISTITTTLATTTTASNSTTTTATTAPVMEGPTTTTSTTIALESSTTTTPATTAPTPAIEGTITTRPTSITAFRINNTTGLFQEIDVSCIMKTAIIQTSCSLTLKLRQRVPSCCILQTLCAASKTSSDIHVEGKDAYEMTPLLDECNSNIQEPNSCMYTGQAGASCLQSCMVILSFYHELPLCNVSAALISVFQSEKKITLTGPVRRAAICGNSTVGENPLSSNFQWIDLIIKPADFCPTIEENNLFSCQNGRNVLYQLGEQCVTGPFTTPSPNVTTPQPNTTTSSVNVTSSPLNTTAQAPNDTTTAASVPLSGLLLPQHSSEGQARALLERTKDISRLNSSDVSQLVSQLGNLLSGPNVSLALGNISVHIVSNLLGATPEVLSDSSNSIIGIVDTVGLKLVLDGKAETLLSPSVALSVQPADGSNFQETFFSISDPNNVQVRGDPRLRRSLGTNSSIPQGSIRLPPSLTQDLTTEQQQLATRVQFNFYQESTVYQDRSLRERKLNSGILGASVANLSIRNLQEDVVIHLRNSEPVPANFVATCVFWDFTLNNESGGWNPKGCHVRNSTDNETVCGCNHLTSFAILLDLSRQPLISREQATILTFITYIGCGISAIFLSITLLTYLAFGKLRKDIPSKILIQLCLALLMLNLVFLVDAWLALYPGAVGLCISTAWFLHYFLLVTFTWMGLEAVHMYLALVKVFNSHISRYMLKFSLVGWGVPMIVVIIVIAIDKDNYGLVSYGKFSDGTSDDFCWLKNDIAFYVSVVAYFCLIFLFNLAMFVVVLVQLCRIKRQNPHNAQHRTTLQDVRSVAGIMILLGLTWGFAFFAWGPLNLPFMYLFAIFNSLQGFFIFVFYCATKENVRKQWRTYLCCGRMRLAENSEWSRTATQKTAKKSSVTRVTSLHSSQSNNSSSSFLVSDSSEQINGVGSPFEDRAITADEDPSMDVVLNEINSQYRNQQAP
ncbi:adhesion G-protein coupled receptor G2-like [Anoplopoma fimbria]|uniref:adhesion G-protein coupled receptor G2-like n=1 Tax=Anoplopoma fimbria TaxID=229290 RepID=UPI0023ECBCE0|nr:adhesion G-protein coupled receptor G2-like [Anoplopoma fimbria]